MPLYATNFVFEDDEGRQTAREILFVVADEAALLTAAALMNTDLQAMSQCGIQRYTYRREVDVSASPGAGSNIDPGATFRVSSALPIASTIKIPDPVEAIKDGQGGINLADAIVTAWWANYNPGDCVVNITNPTQPDAMVQGTLDK